MNGFTKLGFFPITTENNDVLPTYGSVVKIYSGELTNNIKFEVTPNYQTATRKADDTVEEQEKMTGYNASLEIYGFDDNGLEKILGYTKDGNRNFIIEPNKTKVPFGVFFETKEENTDKRVQMYYYKVTLGSMLPSAKTDEKGDPISVTLSLKGTLVKVGGVDTAGAEVSEGKTGFVSTGMPSVVYSKAGSCIVTFAPKDSSTSTAITGADITVNFGTTEITAETNGTYKLGVGSYTYDILADGYVTQTAVALEIASGDISTGTKTIEPSLVSSGT